MLQLILALFAFMDFDFNLDLNDNRLKKEETDDLVIYRIKNIDGETKVDINENTMKISQKSKKETDQSFSSSSYSFMQTLPDYLDTKNYKADQKNGEIIIEFKKKDSNTKPNQPIKNTNII